MTRSSDEDISGEGQTDLPLSDDDDVEENNNNNTSDSEDNDNNSEEEDDDNNDNNNTTEDNEQNNESEDEEIERVELPSIQEQKTMMKDLEMKRPPLRKGDGWYLLENSWYQRWKRHVKYDWVYDVNIPQPDEIDNSKLLVPGTDTLKQVFENQDFVVITKKEWTLFISWYVNPSSFFSFSNIT